MLKSMTGFGRNEVQAEFGNLLWELRSVNHRYLEINLRVPEELRALEPLVRTQIGKKLSRGKVEATLKLRSSQHSMAQLKLDDKALSALAEAIGQVQVAIPQSTGVDPLQVIQWPGVLSANTNQQDEMTQQAMAGLEAALDDLVATREREGEKTADMLRTRCEQIGSHIDVLRQHRPAVVERQREKLKAKLSELNIDHNEHRLEQELVFVAQRLDIDEELDRLAAHVSEFNKAVSRNGPIGRRLDFLMQEFNREANTIGSKAADLDTTGASVDIKVLIEQMREQVQNIE